MEIIELLVVCFFLVLGLYAFDAHRREQRRRFILKERMPEELQTARLILSEHYISTEMPRKMNGAVDQLYRLQTKLNVLVDSKTRDKPRIFKKDIVQLSVYRLILTNQGYQMADYAYIRVVSEEGVNYLKTALLSEADTIKEYDRTKQVLNREVTPMVAEHKGMCASCPQQINCDQWQFASGK